MLSYEYFTSISFKIHLFTPLYFRTCLFSRVLQSCACCPAHSSVIFTGHRIGGILVSLGSSTVAVAAQTRLAYPCGWLPELRSSRTLFQRILHACCVCQLCGTCSIHATLPGVTVTARRGCEGLLLLPLLRAQCWPQLCSTVVCCSICGGEEGAWGANPTGILEEAQCCGQTSVLPVLLWPGPAQCPAARVLHGDSQQGTGCGWPGRTWAPVLASPASAEQPDLLLSQRLDQHRTQWLIPTTLFTFQTFCNSKICAFPDSTSKE